MASRKPKEGRSTINPTQPDHLAHTGVKIWFSFMTNDIYGADGTLNRNRVTHGWRG